MFKKRIEEDELRLKENSPKAKRRREVQIERRKKSFDNLWSEEEI